MTRRRLLLAIAVWIAFALVCLLGGAKADEPANGNRLTITCADVRALVDAFGEAKVEAAARAGWFLGITDRWTRAYFDPDDLHCVDRLLFA